jgi:SOS-response transcriptional repressor LexA
MATLSARAGKQSTPVVKQLDWLVYFSDMNMGKRIAARLNELGWKQVDLLRAVPDLDSKTLSALIIRDSKRSEFAGQIADALSVNVRWLLDGVGEKTLRKGLALAEKQYPSNVGEKLEVRGRIPLISWVQAGTFCQVVDLFEPGDAEEWLPTLHAHGPHAYALRVDGDSMVNPNPLGKTYPPGCIVYVDPDMPITNGCRVIAKIPAEEKATFKMFVEDAGRRYLRPLNPAYPTIEMTDDMLICGVVVGKYERE